MQFLIRNGKYLFFGVLVFVTLSIWTLVLTEQPQHVLKVAVMDIGQGDSIYIESPTGVQIVIDGGPDSSVLAQLPKVMPFLDRSLDALIETHPDADHIGGFVDVLKRYSVSNFIEPGIQKDTLTAQKLEQEVSDEKIPKYIARKGMVLDLGGGAELDVLFPDFDVSHMDQKKDNDGGIVVHLVYGKTSMLLTADISKIVEDHLVAVYGESLKSDILKVAHHGSKYSDDDSFITDVAPTTALISVGAHNTYGHPSPITLSTLSSHNITTLRTDQEGTIEFESDGEKFVRVR